MNNNQWIDITTMEETGFYRVQLNTITGAYRLTKARDTIKDEEQWYPGKPEKGDDLNNQFVMGLAFTTSTFKVLLMKKLKPLWQKDFLNGIGGKIKENETPLQAMERESIEKTGLVFKWHYKGIMSGINNDGNKFICHVFYAYDKQVYNFFQIEKEPLNLYRTDIIKFYPIIENLLYLIPIGVAINNNSFPLKFFRLEY